MTEFIRKRRIDILRMVVCLFFAFGVVLSFKVWHTDRLFPLCPVFEEMHQFTPEVSNFIAILLVILLLIGVFVRKKWFFVLMLSFLLVLLLQDQMRWQPWVYLYVASLFPFALIRRPTEKLLPYFQLLLVGVYLWSGLYKFSGAFIELTFDKMLHTLLLIDNPETRESLHFLGYSIPVIEVLIAVGLIVPGTRKIAVFSGISAHIVILTYLLVNGQNTVVYPWNVAMILLLLTVFYKTDNSLAFWRNSSLRTAILQGSAAFFFIVMPVLNPVGLWDNYLSFKLYSGNNGYFCVGLGKDQYRKIDTELHGYFWQVQEPRGKYWLLLNKWALDELNVPFYPEMRTFKIVSRSFCNGDIPPEKLEFVRYPPDFGRDGAEIFGCDAN